ncbi:hypothetical protein [Stenotrophomonas rhizophila]|uniref:hypothetical protein n=1 Tax=Stenotrophomonas rhizophila TaxID=216778 RepID=UPI001E490CEF|nr:hypothetical protein [Stenotrophomonas rhizophila]MCC7633069.1 hypothetical protein [Stenotrophomonas rhizophila]MCC7661962.1 hypothetical protein [Stenotrophomonas rhizophila]
MHMERSRLSVVLTALLASASAPAAADIGTLSRANCLGFVNESVTYDRPQLRNFYGTALSDHLPLGDLISAHMLSSPDQLLSWRHYAGDTNDSEVMKVNGYHSWMLMDENFNLIEHGTRETSTVDCSVTEW